MTRIRRRSFLAAGALSAVLPLRRLASAMDETPRRFVFFLSGNGFDAAGLFSNDVRAFVERETGGTVFTGQRFGSNGNPYGLDGDSPEIFEGNLTTAPYLSSLGALAEKSAVVFGLSSRVTGGFHGSAHGVLSSTRTLSRRPSGQTIDALLASLPSVRGIGDQRSPVDAVRLGVLAGETRSVSYGNSAASVGQPLPSINSTQAAWDAFVDPLVSPNGGTRLERRNRMLRHALRETEAALVDVPPGLPHAQIQSHRDALRELQENQAQFARVIASYTGSTAPIRPDDTAPPLTRMRDQAANIAFALRHGVTNVAVLGMGSSDNSFGRFNYYLGALQGGAHDFRHRFDDDTGVGAEERAFREAIRHDFREVWRQEVEAFSSIAHALDAVPENGGTMLDHTVLVYLPDNGAEHHSTGRDFPVLLVGGGALGLRTGGRSILYPHFNSGSIGRRQLSNLWNTLGGRLCGRTLDDFGAEGANRFAEGPLSELLD